MATYGQVFAEQALIGILEAYDDLHFGNPAFNRGKILEAGGKSAVYNYDGARVTFQIQHVGNGIKVGLVQFAWNDEPDAVFIDGTYEPEEGAVITIDPRNPPKPGDPALDGSGLVYEGDADIGGTMQYSGRWIKPLKLLRAED